MGAVWGCVGVVYGALSGLCRGGEWGDVGVVSGVVSGVLYG